MSVIWCKITELLSVTEKLISFHDVFYFIAFKYSYTLPPSYFLCTISRLLSWDTLMSGDSFLFSFSFFFFLRLNLRVFLSISSPFFFCLDLWSLVQARNSKQDHINKDPALCWPRATKEEEEDDDNDDVLRVAMFFPDDEVFFWWRFLFHVWIFSVRWWLFQNDGVVNWISEPTRVRIPVPDFPAHPWDRLLFETGFCLRPDFVWDRLLFETGCCLRSG